MRLTRLELAIMDAIWRLGAVSVREVQDALPRTRRPAYTTVQTIVYRLEAKGAVRRAKKIGNANVFEALITRSAAHTKLIDDLLSAFGGGAQPLMAHLVETGKITRADLDDARRRLEELTRPARSKGKPR
jgi:BlaI family transcriptional regulator, penicillinase repressor